MMIPFIFLTLSVLLGGYYFHQTRKVSKENNVLKEQSNAANIRAIQAEKECDLLRDNLHYERKNRIENEQLLKEQLIALSKAVVNDTSQQLKTENRQQIAQLLEPFKEKLTSFEKEVQLQKEKGLEQFASMESLVKALSAQHTHMSNSAENLSKALKGEQKTQGNWGEMALERILELSGLEAGRDYSKQFTVRGEEQQVLRPDFVVHLPENKHIIIDSKVSLTAFERWINSEDELERKVALKDHLVSIHSHIKQLGDKNYTNADRLNAPEFVLLFIPMESSFSLAIKEEPDIYTRAWEKRVVIVTPSTLLATLKTIESIWKQERQTINAIKIAVEAGRMYDKFVAFVEDIKLIDKKQREALTATDAAMRKLSDGNGNLLGKMEQLKKMGAKASKQLDQTD